MSVILLRLRTKIKAIPAEFFQKLGFENNTLFVGS